MRHRNETQNLSPSAKASADCKRGLKWAQGPVPHGAKHMVNSPQAELEKNHT